jgi:D-beta-D-heptose 7-phosphate kinase/D-beta-D-heptose 1-phosphate adenosyltransferase
MGQFLNQSQLKNKIEEIRQSGVSKSGNSKVVFTNGCFDILHVGHVKYLQEAKAQGDILVVGINADESVRKLKGKERPIQNEEDRGEVLSALGCVDFVTIFEEDTPENLIKLIKPDILVKGGDWKVDQIVGSDFVMSYGGKVKSLQFVQGKSTTGIVSKILKL